MSYNRHHFLMVAKHFARKGYATDGAVDGGDIGNLADVQRMDTGAGNIQNKIGGLNQFLSGFDLEANTPQFNTGMNQPQVGGAGMPASQRIDNLAKFQEGNHPEVPPVVYHGTGGDFSEYQITNKGAGSRESPIGYWFTENPSAASDFANFSARGSGANVQPVHLSIKNPLVVENYNAIKDLVDAHTNFERPGYTVVGRQIRMVGDKVDYGALRNNLINAGYDGIILPSTFMDSPDGLTPIKQIVAFHPHQIKSATGNNGQFDLSNPDITKKKGGFVRMGRKHGGKVLTHGLGMGSKPVQPNALLHKEKDPSKVGLISKKTNNAAGDLPKTGTIEWHKPVAAQNDVVQNAIRHRLSDFDIQEKKSRATGGRLNNHMVDRALEILPKSGSPLHEAVSFAKQQQPGRRS